MSIYLALENWSGLKVRFLLKGVGGRGTKLHFSQNSFGSEVFFPFLIVYLFSWQHLSGGAKLGVKTQGEERRGRAHAKVTSAAAATAAAQQRY